MPEQTQVVLADDHPALRVGLRVLLDREPDIIVIGEADDGEAALAMALEYTPDVLVLDCQLPKLDGARVASALRERGNATKIVALSAYDDASYISDMIQAGAVGYLLKNEAPGQIVAAVRAAVAGASLWTGSQRARASQWQSQVAKVRDSLTNREHEVLRLIAAGLSNKEIAQELTVTVRTADFHVSNILRKLDAVSRVEAAVWAQQHLDL